MHLEADSTLCEACKEKACMNFCPKSLSINALKCKHCKPEEARCALVCRKNAFYKVTENIVSIDKELCDGCGACMKACSYRAITIVEGKASKCDLCAEHGFEIVCARECPKGAIKIEKSDRECLLTEKLLGWKCFSIDKKIRKVYRKRPKIVEAEGYIWYILPLPELSSEEANLVKDVLDGFQNNGYGQKDIEKALTHYCFDNEILLDDNQKSYLVKLLKSLANGFGPIDELLSDEELEEIALTGIGIEKPLKVFHQTFGWCNINLCFTDEETVRNLVNKMLRNNERRLTLNSPCVNGMLPDGSRINATLPPVSVGEPTFTIRKFNVKRFTPEELVRNKTFTLELMAFLNCVMQTDCSIMVAGNTGSGKTTSLNAIFNFVPKDERVVIIEETPELQIPHKHAVKLSVCREKNVGMHKLIENSLRMRPDRIVVSEIRNSAEAKAFINTLLAGQGKGSYTTFHANSAEDTVKRLEFLGVKRVDIGSIDLVLVQRRWPVMKNGRSIEQRRIVEVSELENNSENIIYSYDYKKGILKKNSESKKVFEKIERTFGESANAVVRRFSKSMRKKIFFGDKSAIAQLH
ncbi:MAG: ATPase, T2SS/T4P/T4SS family [Candidatus Diapherotrites archaeon]|nr:ATPase, T2SS/T4P/T4SS family [Candidatus Diapherotrites archaeon]